MVPWTFCCQTFIYPACGHNGKIIYQSVMQRLQKLGEIFPLWTLHIMHQRHFSHYWIAVHFVTGQYLMQCSALQCITTDCIGELQCIAVNNSALQCSTVKCTGVLNTSLHLLSCILSLGHSEPNRVLSLYYTVLYCTVQTCFNSWWQASCWPKEYLPNLL